MSNEKETILIYDDDRQRAEVFMKKLEDGLRKAKQDEIFDFIFYDDNEFQESITVLQNRQNRFRDNKDIYQEDEMMKIDNASIFIIDYDLLGSQKKNSFTGSLTGEIVAYLVRCFSKCKLIVGVNQYGMNPYDLTLRRELDSFSDLNLGENQLDNPGLWISDWEDSEQEFRPWAWPNLCNLLRDFDERIKDVEGDDLKTAICSVIKFDPQIFRMLPREIVQFIGQYEEKEPSQTTFQEFVTISGNGLRHKDAKGLDDNINEHVLARVGAARISKWLEQLVLPEQDILVDAPHLVSRYPSLINGDKEKIENWDKTARLVRHEDLGLDTKLIEDYRFQKSHWISRPVWFWDELRECEDIKEVTDPWLTATPNWVFCEDASHFYNHENCREFLADTTSPFTQRFVRYFTELEIDYRPRARFSL